MCIWCLQVVQRADTAAPPAVDLRCPGAAVAGDNGGSEGSGSAAKVLGRECKCAAHDCCLGHCSAIFIGACWHHPGYRLAADIVCQSRRTVRRLEALAAMAAGLRCGAACPARCRGVGPRLLRGVLPVAAARRSLAPPPSCRLQRQVQAISLIVTCVRWRGAGGEAGRFDHPASAMPVEP